MKKMIGSVGWLGRVGLTLIILSVLMAPGIARAEAPMLNLGVKEGDLAPEVTLQDASGKWVSLSDFRGKKVFLFSWSSWCRCKYQLPELEQFYREHQARNFEIVAVASDSQGFTWAQKYLDVADASFVSLVDPNHELSRKYDFWATENGFLIDEGGVVRKTWIPFFIQEPEHRQELIRLIETDFGAEWAEGSVVPLEPRLDEAESMVARRPWSFKRRLELAELYRQSGDLDRAESALRSALQLRWVSAEAHFRLGVVLYQRGEVEKGVEQWETAYSLEPTNYIYMRNVQAYRDPERFYQEVMEEPPPL